MKYVRFILLIVMSVSILQGCNTAKEKADKAEDKTENVKNAAENKAENVKNTVEDKTKDDRKETSDSNTNNNETKDEYDEEKFKLDNETVPFTFHKFKLKVIYENDKEYKAEFEKEEDDYLEAEFKDDNINEEIEGKEAYDKLKDKLEKLTFDQNTDTNKIIEEVTKEFDLNPDYKSLKLKVRFEDGTEKEYTK